MITSSEPVMSFVIPVRNGARDLPRLLRSIKASAVAAEVPFEIVIGDNGSTDDTAAVANDLGARVVAVPVGRASAVRNAAAAVARGELLAFIDADHELAPEWCAAAREPFGDPSVVAAGAQYHAPENGTWVQRTYDGLRRRGSEPQEVEWLPSGNIVVRRTVFEQIRGFDATLETCEDVDFSQRLWRTGGRMLAVPGLRSTHFGDPQTLRALFVGELWRGRDNWRVTMNGPLTPRSVASALIPLVTLLSVVFVLVGVAAVPFGGGWLALIGVGSIAALVMLRAVPLASRGRAHRPSALAAVQAIAVSTVYNAARAFALVIPGAHQLRRSA